jgi:hypothetical protein
MTHTFYNNSEFGHVTLCYFMVLLIVAYVNET